MAGTKASRRVWLAALAVGVLLLVPAILLTAQGPSAAGSTVLTIFTRNVLVAHGFGAFAAATEGELIANGDRVRTDDAGHALVTFFDGSTLEIEPSTTIGIEAAAANANGSITISITQAIGRTWASVEKLTHPDSKFEIKTPSSTAAVRGTAFLTDVTASGDTRVETSDGTVAVTAQGQTVLVTVGQSTTVQQNQRPTPPSARPAPANTLRFGMHSPAHIVVVDPFGRSCGIAMPGARIVRQIPGCVTSDVGAEPETVDVPNAAAGTYRTTITAIDPGGAFTLTATGIDRASNTLFDLSLVGNGVPGAVFASLLDVSVTPDGRIAASALGALTLLQGPVSAAPSPSATPSATPEFVSNSPLPTPPVLVVSPTPSRTATPTPAPRASATPTPTASPTPTPTASPTPTPSPAPPTAPPPSASPTPTPAPSRSPSPTPTPTPLPGCMPSGNQPNKCK